MAEILLHIGFPKSGSTYLQKWFELHPELYFQPKHFAQGFYNAWEFARYAQENKTVAEKYVLSCEDLSIFNSQRDPIGHRVTHPFDYRSFQNNVCNMLHNLFPNGKILIVTRGYTTIFKSLYSEYISMTGSLSPENFVAADKELFQFMFDYSYVINLYREKFGRDNVLVLPYELMRDDLPKFLSLIENELHLSAKVQLGYEKINASYNNEILTAYQRTSFFVYRFLKIFPHSWQLKMYPYYSKLFRSNEPHLFMVILSKFVSTPLNMNELAPLTEAMRGKADILKTEELYQPYLKEYLL